MLFPPFQRSLLLVGLSCAALASVTARADPDENGTAAKPAQTIQISPAQIEVKVDPEAGPVAQLAAKELRTHLAKLATLQDSAESKAFAGEPYVVYVGDSGFARNEGLDVHSMPHDGFQMKVTEKWMIIAGRDYSGPPLVGFNNPWRLHESYSDTLKIGAFGDAGTLQGVYFFLRETAGVRWYMPGPLGTVIPNPTTLDLTVGTISRSPRFEHRHAYFGFFPTSDEDALWYRRVGFGTPSPVQITHSLGHFFLKYKETRPEYFALIDGRRDFTTLSTIMGPGNFDLTNEGFQAAVVKEIRDYFDANPDQLVFPLSPNDGMMRITDAAEAQKQITPERGELGKFSNYVWGFIDRVAREVAKTHPDRLIGSLAYEAYTLPPTNIEKMSPNVAVMYCKTRRNFTNAAYEEDIRRGLVKWKEKAANIYCWEYYNDIFSNSGWKGYPVFYPQIIQDDLRWLATLPTKGEFIEAESWRAEDYAVSGMTKVNYPGLQHLNLYLTARLLWDPKQDVRKLTDEYFRGFYGPAEKEMRSFWDMAEEAWMAKGKATTPSEVYTAEGLARMLDALKRAEAIVPASSLYAQRVRLILEEFKPAAQKQQLLEKLRHPVVTVPKISADKDPSDQDWDLAPLLTLVDRSYTTPQQPTHVRILRTPNRLLLEVICFEPHASAVIAGATQKDQTEAPALWTDDSIELFFSEKNSAKSPGVQFVINSKGAMLDAKLDPATGQFNPKWDSEAVASARTEPGKWILRVSIPLKSLPFEDDKKNSSLAMNIYRNRFAGEAMVQTSWAPLVEARYFQPEEFGTLKLSPPLQTPSLR
ncbi:hypothetical protein BH09VER1_BH09VER1_47730 [soil metagenome]